LHILINDFIGGVLDRGMATYTRSIIDGLREEGFRVSVVRAPRFFRKVPRDLFYMIAVLVEQTVLPIVGLVTRADITLYPYNSVAIADLLTRRARIVIHDLEQLNRGMSPSKLYYLVCYRALKALSRPVFTNSQLTRQRLIESGLFGTCPIAILPVTFYAYERLLRAEAPKRNDKMSILLCTGSTANKDLETVVADYLPKLFANGFQVTIVGLHKASDRPRFAPLDHYLTSGRLRICGRLSDPDVALEYQKHEIVWVHALREGFGRCVVEGRLAGSRVVCTNIPEFADMRAQMRDDAETYLYKDSTEFMTILERLVHTDAPPAAFSGYPYREMLRSAIQGGL
jgi:glycosyltransferase involved in cell wall biosynthesis